MEGSHQVGAFVHANLNEVGGGVMSLTNCTVLLTGDDGYGLSVQYGKTLNATGTTINMTGDRNVGANSYGGAVSLTNCNVTLTGNAYGAIGADDTSLRGSTASATNTTISVTGNQNKSPKHILAGW
jgi:hypothetical protein